MQSSDRQKSNVLYQIQYSQCLFMQNSSKQRKKNLKIKKNDADGENDARGDDKVVILFFSFSFIPTFFALSIKPIVIKSQCSRVQA